MDDVWKERRSDWLPQPEDARSPFDVDYARVVHSGSFRRLQGKTQILNLGDSDFYRTRLTHSLEVAQISGGLSRQLSLHFKDHPGHSYLPSPAMIQAIGFTHDLGHPPFGHGGEIALNYCMRENGGFEGNGQTLRILARLENFSKDHGSDLTRRSLLAVLKYPVPYSRVANEALSACLVNEATTVRIIDREKSKPPKCYLDSERDIVDWILNPISKTDRGYFEAVKEESGKHSRAIHKSFDCSIMDIADDIAYGVHDLEDVIALRLIREDDFREAIGKAGCITFLKSLEIKYPDEVGNDTYEYFIQKLFGDSKDRKHFIGRLVHHFMTNVEIDTIEDFKEPLLRYRVKMKMGPLEFLSALKKLVVDKVIKSPNVQHLEFKGQKMVVSVFEAFESEPKSFLPNDAYRQFEVSDGDIRVICDYVAGMTDGFLLKTYDRLFSPRMGSVFDKL